MEPRIGDAERDAAVAALRRHVGEGRLTLDEFAERAEQVLAAKVQSEIDGAFTDLPSLEPPDPAGTAALPAAAPVAWPTPDGGRARFTAIMSGTAAKGRWRAAPRISALAFCGSVDLDLRHAVIESPVVDIDAMAVMGGISITVPEGIPVEMDGSVIMGGAANRTKGEPLEGAPLVRVHAAGLWGGVSVRSRPAHSRDAAPHGAAPAAPPAAPVPPVVPAPVALPGGVPVPPVPPVPPWPPQASRGARPGSTHGWTGTQPPRRRAPAEPAQDLLADVAPGAPAPDGVPTGTLTILFTDIVGSTALAEALGDHGWLEVLRAHDRLVRTSVASHGGTVIKGNGDGFLVVFRSAREAVLAAIGIQQDLELHRRDSPTPVEARMGLHTGEVVEQGGDVFGRNVIVAARIAGEAGPGQVLVSSLTKELCDSAGDLGFSDGEERELRGLARAWRVHEVAWR